MGRHSRNSAMALSIRLASNRVSQIHDGNHTCPNHSLLQAAIGRKGPKSLNERYVEYSWGGLQRWKTHTHNRNVLQDFVTSLLLLARKPEKQRREWVELK